MESSFHGYIVSVHSLTSAVNPYFREKMNRTAANACKPRNYRVNSRGLATASVDRADMNENVLQKTVAA